MSEVFMFQPDGIYSDSGDGPEKISDALTRASVQSEPCEDCENGISEVCGRCELLADLDGEA